MELGTKYLVAMCSQLRVSKIYLARLYKYHQVLGAFRALAVGNPST